MNLAIVVGIFFSIQVASAAKLECFDLALTTAAKEMEYASTDEFLNANSLIWSCKSRTNPNQEEIQFGDGSGLVGVALELSNGECKVTDVYTGQDDGDGDPEADKLNCLD